jgi:hypothetical protein
MDMIGGFLDVDYIGDLKIRANSSRIGDTYKLKASGLLTSATGEDISIRMFSNFEGDRRLMFDCSPRLDQLLAGYWEIEAEIVFRGSSVLVTGNFGQFPINASKSFTGVGFSSESLLIRTDDNDLSLRYTGYLDLFTCTQAVLTKIF